MLNRDEKMRYARHLILPDVGEEGQERLKRSSVLVVGAGGLGSPVLMYLAAAGVGTIGIAEFDTVDVSNLQRQIIHDTSRIGEPKALSAAARIQSLNPHVTVRIIGERLTSANALSVLKEFDVIIDGTDNFPTRYLLNDASVFLRKPLIYGSVFRFEGQVSVFDAARGPCYRCLFPEPPPASFSPGCAEAGVLGVLPGLTGLLQATETIKLIAGIGEPLVGRMLLIDALRPAFDELQLQKDPGCVVCGEHPSVTELIDYEEFCSPSQLQEQEGMVQEITVQELKKKRDAGESFVLVDVRQEDEHEFVNIGGVLLPLHELAERLSELDPAAETIVYCRSGSRSASAVRFLEQNGFSKVKNLRGGILAWATHIDPSLPKY